MAENLVVDRLRSFLDADDDERRALERALHDGLQQQLVGLITTLQLAQQLVDADPRAAAAALAQARGVLRQALDETRALAQRIHPSLLDSQGLLAALRMAAAAAPLPTSVEGAVACAVPPDAAVTVYRCCVAALAGGGGDDSRATISIRDDAGTLEFEVALTGGVIDPAALIPLAVRTEVLGGSLHIAADRVAGRLPLTS